MRVRGRKSLVWTAVVVLSRTPWCRMEGVGDWRVQDEGESGSGGAVAQ